MNKQNFTLEEIERQIEAARKSEKSFGARIAGFFRFVLQIAILPALVYLVFAFLLGIAQIEQSSMLPNFAEGDIVIFNRLENDYSFGDVIVVQSVEEQTLTVKRVIGVPGDTVQINDNSQILINGNVVRENWQSTGTLTSGAASLPITLKEGEYFVLCDNHDANADSRTSSIGNIKEDEILGIVVYRFKMSK